MLLFLYMPVFHADDKIGEKTFQLSSRFTGGNWLFYWPHHNIASSNT